MNRGFRPLYCAAIMGFSSNLLLATSALSATLAGGINADNSHTTYISTDDSIAGTPVASGNSWPTRDTFSGEALQAGVPHFLHIAAVDAGGVAGILADFTLTGGGHTFPGGSTSTATSTSWMVSNTGWSDYVAATSHGSYDASPWNRSSPPGDPAALWIWTADNDGDNAVYFSMAILPTPTDLTAVKLLDTPGPHYVGDSVQFTVTISNTGSDTAADLQISNVVDNLTITDVSSTHCSAFPCTVSSLAGGSTEVITVTATIDALGSFNISPSVTSVTGDPDSTNNTDSAASSGTAVVNPPPAGPPVVSATPAPEQVPTMPQWLLIAMTAVISLMGANKAGRG